MGTWGDSVPAKGEQRRRKREALMQQAALAFRRRGFHATSMEDIANALGVTKGALYRYITSKHEVLYECHKAAERLGDASLELARASGGSGLNKVQVFLRAFLEGYLSSANAGAAMADLDALLAEQRADVVNGRDRVDQGFRRLVEQGVKDGSIHSKNPKIAVFTMMGSINWIPSWFSPDGELDVRAVADSVIDLFVQGLASPEQRRKA